MGRRKSTVSISSVNSDSSTKSNGSTTTVKTRDTSQGLKVAHDGFKELITNPTGKFAFHRFLEEEGQTNSLDFWCEVERFRSIQDEKESNNLAGLIYSTYLHIDASREVDLPKQERERVITALKKPKKTMFDSAQEVVFDFLFNDAYGRFVFVVLQRKAQMKLKNPTSDASFLGLGDCFCLTDPNQKDNPIVGASDGFIKVTGYSREDIIPHNCRFLQGRDTDREVVRRIGQNLRDGKEVTEFLLNYRKDGTPFWNLLYICPLKGEEGRIQFFLGGQVDVTKNINNNCILKDILECVEYETAPAETSQQEKKPKMSSLAELFGKKAVPLTSGLCAEAEIVNGSLDIETQKSVFLETYTNFLIFEAKNKSPTISFVSSKFTEITGFVEKDVIGKGPKFFQGALTSKSSIAEWKQAMKENIPWSKKIICYDSKGVSHWNNVYLTPIKSLEGKARFHIIVMKWEDMTQEEIEAEKIKVSNDKEKTSDECFLN